MAIGKITSKSLAADAVTSANLAPGAVTISDIPDSEITADKLHTTLDLSTKTLTLTQASVTAHESALTVTQSQISDLSTTSDLAEGTNLYYTDARADARAQLKIDALVGAAPGTLDTLEELGDALGDDPNFATTVTNSIATKLPLAGGTMTGALTTTGLTVQSSTGQLRLQGTSNTNLNVSIFYNESGDYGQINVDESGVNQKDLWVTGLNLKFGRNTSSESMRIDSSGNIKFGPNGEGYINGAAQNTYNSGFNVNADDFSTWINYSGYQGGTTKFRDLIIGNGKGSRVATIDGSSGNVGIGVTPSNYPSYRTIIKRDDNTAMPTSGISNEAVLALINDSTTLYSWSNLVLRAGTGDAGIAAVYQGSANNSDLILYTDGGNNGVERMRIKNNGNVGIGTNDPQELLHVSGSTSGGASGNSYAHIQAIIENTHSTNGRHGAGLRLHSNDAGTYGAEIYMSSDANGNNFEGLGIRTFESFPIVFQTNTEAARIASGSTSVGNPEANTAGILNNERMRITPSGNVGIGTTNPNRKLEVVSDIDGSPLRIQGNSSITQMEFAVSGGAVEAGIASSANELAFRVGSSSSSAEKMRMTTAGYYHFNSTGGHGPGGMVNITNGGTNTVTANALNVRSDTVNYALTLTNTVNGDCIWFSDNGTNGRGSINVTSSGTTYNTTSDRRLKDNIQPISDATDKLMDMKPVTHTWIANPNDPQVHGFIAQEMKEIIPEAVHGEPDGDEMMSMDYGRITPVIVAALQDALKEIKELKTRIDELENK